MSETSNYQEILDKNAKKYHQGATTYQDILDKNRQKFSPSADDIMQRNRNRFNSSAEINGSFINQFLNDYNDYYGNYALGNKSRYYRLDDRKASILDYLDMNRENIGEDYYNEVMRLMNQAEGYGMVSQYAGDYNSFYNDAAERLNNLGWEEGYNASGLLDLSGMNSRDAEVRQWLLDNKTWMDDSYYNQLIQRLDDLAGMGSSLADGYTSAQDYYSQWDTQEAFDRHQRLLGMDIAEEEAWLQNIEKDYEDMQVLAGEYGMLNNPDVPEDIQAQNRARYEQIVNRYGVTSAEELWEQMDGIHQRRIDLRDAREIQAEAQLQEQIPKWQEKYDGKTYTQLSGVLEAMEDGEEKQWLSQYADSIMTSRDMSVEIGKLNNRIAKADRVLEGYRDRMKDHDTGGSSKDDAEIRARANEYLQRNGYQNIDALEAEWEALNNRKWELDKRQKYGGIEARSDFDAESQVKDGPQGILYAYINDLPTTQPLSGGKQIGTRESITRNAAEAGGSNPYERYDYMTDDERSIYNYIHNTQGSGAAQEYLDYLSYTLNARRTEAIRGAFQTMNFREGAAASAISVPANLLSGIGTIDVAFQNLKRDIRYRKTGEYTGPIDYNSDAMTATHLSGGIRESVSKSLADRFGVIDIDPDKAPMFAKILNGKSWGDVYQLGMSMLDSIAIRKLVPIIGRSGTVLLGGAAASQGMLHALEQGATDEQALKMGLFSGLWETLFESWSLDKILSLDTTSILKAFAKQGFIEATEEANTGIANYLTDVIVMGRSSEFQNKVRDYTQMGYTEEEAKKQAFWDAVIQVGWDFAGGFISGGLMGGGQTLQQNVQYRRLPANIRNQADRFQEEGIGRNEAVFMASALDLLAEEYGDQAEVFRSNFRTSQDVAEYQREFHKAYKMGVNNANRESLNQEGAFQNLTEEQRTAAYEAGVAAREAKNAKAVESKAAEKTAQEGGYAVSEEGKTIRTDTGAEVEIKGFRRIGANPVLDTKSGNTVNAADVSYASAGEAALYEIIGKSFQSVEGANTALEIYRNSGMTAEDFAAGVEQAFNEGQLGQIPLRQVMAMDLASQIPEAVIKAAYNAGEAQGRRAARTEQREITRRNPRRGNPAREGKLHFDRKGRTFDEARETSLSAMETLAKALGIDIYVFESYEKDGKRVYIDESGQEVKAPNGFYDPSNSSIHIDLNAGNLGKGTMLFTVAHELTHFIRQWSKVKFRTMADILIRQYGEQGTPVEDLIAGQIAKAANNEREISREEAFEEVVADSMETMLVKGDLAQFVTDVQQRDKNLGTKIRYWLRNLADKLRAAVKAYGDVNPETAEGRLVAQMGDFVEELQKAYGEALMEASENYRAAEGQIQPGAEGTVYNKQGEPVAHATEDGSVQLSLRTYDEQGREEFRKYLRKCVQNKRLTNEEMEEMLSGIEEIYHVCQEFMDTYAPFAKWSNAEVVRDTYGKPVFSVVTPNGEYKMNLDFSLVCKKRRTLDAVFNEMARRGIIDDFELGQKSVVKINEIIRKYGLETACALCFVDAKRFRQASMADSFVQLYNDLVYSLVPENQHKNISRFNFAQYSSIKPAENAIDTWSNDQLDFSHLDHVMQTYGSKTVEYKAAKYIKTHPEGRKLLLRGDFMGSNSFDAVKAQNKDILSLYNSKKGTGGPKAAFGDVQYMNEIIRNTRGWSVSKAYDVGGVRIQSFSDYVPRMVFDYVQMIYDLSVRNLPAHAYTKEEIFVKQFGLTGVKINMSLIPAVVKDGIAPGLDKNGDYVWAGESFNFEAAKRIQNADGYTENCGTICVGVSYDHIVKLLGDPNIRMVIPYHKSGLNPIVAHMNKIASFTDYTSLKTNPGGCQNTTDQNGSKVEKEFDFNKALRRTNDPIRAAEEYKAWCAERNYNPKFQEFAWHPNYYKLLVDFTVYDKNGNYVPQRGVSAVFPKTGDAFGSMKQLIESGLEEDAIAEGKRDKNLGAIVDEIHRTLPKTEAEIEEVEVEQADRDLEADNSIKRSDRDPIAAVMAQELERQNAQLIADVENLKKLLAMQGKVTGGKVFKPSSVAAAAEYLAKTAEAALTDAQKIELARMLGEFYAYIANNDEPVWEDIRERADPIARFLDQENAIETKSTEYAYEYEMIHADMVRAVYDSFWRVENLRTVEKNREEIKDLQAEHRKSMKKLRDENKQIRKDRSDMRKKYLDRIRNMETRSRNTRESRKKTEMRHRIQDVVNELNRLLLHGDRKHHVPEILRKSVAEILDAINMEVTSEEDRQKNFERTLARYERMIREETNPEKKKMLEVARDAYRNKGDQFKTKMENLKKAYDAIKEDNDPILSNAYKDGLSAHIGKLIVEVGDTPLRLMNLKQLETVYEVCRMVTDSIRNANKSFTNERAGTIAKQGGRSAAEVRQAGGERGSRLTFLDPVRKFLWNNFKPVNAMEIIGSQTLMEAFKQIRNGEDVWAKDIRQARQFFREVADKYGYDEWDPRQVAEFTTPSGKTFQLTLGQMMSIYAYSKRENAQEHLRLGGIVFDPYQAAYRDDVNKKNKLKLKRSMNDATAYQISMDTVKQIMQTLTQEQIGFVDEMQKYLSETMGAKGNEVSMAMFGVKLFRETNYFPMKSARQFLFEQNQPAGEVKLVNSGFTKAIQPGANNPIVLGDFVDVWSKHVNDMSSYHGFALPIEDFNRIYNYQTGKSEGREPVSVKSAIQSAYSPAATEYISQMITDVNGGARIDPAAGIMGRMLSLFKKGAVFASWSVVIQQPSSIGRALALIDGKYFIGQRLDPKKHDETWEEVKEYAPVAIIKEMGFFDTSVGKATQDYITGKEYHGFLEKFTAFFADSRYRDEKFSRAPALADELTWCAIWEAVKREQAELNPNADVKSKAFLEQCGERFTEIITKTQVYDSVLSRSANMRSKDTGMQMATAFMAEPITSINMLADALIKGKRGNKQFARKAIGAVIASQILNAVLVSLVYAMRDDDEDKNYEEKYLKHLSENLVTNVFFLVPNSLPFMRDIMSLCQGYEVERSDMSVISDIFKAFKSVGNKKMTPWEKAEKVSGSVAQLFGLPVKNILRDTRGLVNTVRGFFYRETATGAGLWYAVLEGATGKAISQGEQLYQARKKGDEAHASRLEARYTKESPDSAVRNVIRKQFEDGDIDELEAARQLVLYGGQNSNEAHWTVDAWKYQRDNGNSDGYRLYGRFYDAMLAGNSIDDTLEEFTEYGYDEEDVLSNLKKEIGKWYYDDESDTRVTREEVERMLESYFDLDGAEIEEQMLKWDMRLETGFSYQDLKEQFFSGAVTEEQAMKYLQKYGQLHEADAKERMADWKFEQEHGYSYDDIRITYQDGEITAAEARQVMMEFAGKTREEADKSLKMWDFELKEGWAYEDRAKLYKRGEISESQLRNALIKVGEYSAENAEAQIQVYDLEAKGYDGATVSNVKKYNEFCKPAGVSIEAYLQIVEFSENTENDIDPQTGKRINYSAVKKVMAQIDSLAISNAQKTAIALALWKESTVSKYKPW